MQIRGAQWRHHTSKSKLLSRDDVLILIQSWQAQPGICIGRGHPTTKRTVCVCVCVRACVRAFLVCVRACVRACVRVCVKGLRAKRVKRQIRHFAQTCLRPNVSTFSSYSRQHIAKHAVFKTFVLSFSPKRDISYLSNQQPLIVVGDYSEVND